MQAIVILNDISVIYCSCSTVKLLHLLIVGVISIVVAITSLALVVYTVTGLVEVCVEIVKP